MPENGEFEIWQKLRLYGKEIDLHAKRLRQAREKCRPFMPLQQERYETLREEQVEHLDWMLYRFAKMQDSMAQKLFPCALATLENDENWLNRPFIDLLNRMERIALLPDARKWRSLRGVRNMIAHDYETMPDKAVATLNDIYEASERLFEIWAHIRHYLQERKLL